MRKVTDRAGNAPPVKSSFPKTIREFQRQFATEEACQDYLATCRWPEGFTCPRCGHRSAYHLVKQRRWQCAGCRYQVSLTAGTVLHNTKTPLAVWFWAAYLAVTDKRGISALLLQRQLGLRRYQTAWMLLHKLRRAMVNTAREPLHGDVEIDDTWVGGPQPGLRGSRQMKGRKAAIGTGGRGETWRRMHESSSRCGTAAVPSGTPRRRPRTTPGSSGRCVSRRSSGPARGRGPCRAPSW